MKILPLLGLPLVVISGCSSSDPLPLPQVVPYNSPVDAHNAVRRNHPGYVVQGYRRRPVVEPQGWRDRSVPSKMTKEPGS